MQEAVFGQRDNNVSEEPLATIYNVFYNIPLKMTPAEASLHLISTKVHGVISQTTLIVTNFVILKSTTPKFWVSKKQFHD
jgi:hypothetical protein